MIDCEEFRKAVGASPSDEAEELARHETACADCRAWRDQLKSLDETLARALAVPVPAPAMPAFDDDAGSDRVVETRRRRPPVPAWFGIAAGLALAAYAGLFVLSGGGPERSLAEQVIAHMDHEAGSRVVTDVAVPERTLEAVVSNHVSRMGSGIGLVTYARSCVINGRTIPHLVVQGENGPITLLLMPDEPVDSAVPLEGESIIGVILPVGDGSVAIVGEREQDIRATGDRVVDSVKWKT